MSNSPTAAGVRPAGGVTADQLAHIAELVWSATLDATLHRRLGPAPRPGRTVTGLVTIAGSWRGVVGVAVSPRHARDVAAAMFATDPAGLTDDDLADALAEVTNMVGGQVKGLLPEPSMLSLPSVIVAAADRRRPALPPLVEQASLCCGSELVQVTVRQS